MDSVLLASGVILSAFESLGLIALLNLCWEVKGYYEVYEGGASPPIDGRCRELTIIYALWIVMNAMLIVLRVSWVSLRLLDWALQSEHYDFW